MLENLGTPPEAGVQDLVQISIVALVHTEGIVELVGRLEPGEDQEDDEELQQQQDFSNQLQVLGKLGDW